MTPFEEQIVRALGSIAESFRMLEEQRKHDKEELHQKLDAAISYRDEALAADLASTNRRLSDVEKHIRREGSNGRHT